MLFFLLLLSISTKAQNKCSNPVPINPYEADFDSGTLELSNNYPSAWDCFDSGIIHQNAYVFKFSSKLDATYIASTCYPETSIAPRIIIGSECLTETTTKCIGAEEISQNVCEGHRSKVRFNVTSNQLIYLMVTGVTNEETGIFRLTVTKETDSTNHYCSNAKSITLPVTINDNIDTTHTKPDCYGLLHGYWYKFTAQKSKVYINNCNRFTTESTAIYLFDANSVNITSNCNYDKPCIKASKNCGLKSRLAYDLIAGKTYYVFIASLVYDIYHPDEGFIQTYFSYEQDASTCEDAYSLNSFPATVQANISGLEKKETGCGKFNYGFYTVVKGDDNRYAVQTCATSTGYNSDLEIFVDGCNVCLSEGYSKCGSNAYFVMFFAKNHYYYIRASSSYSYNEITLSVTRVENVDNYKCETASDVTLIHKGDVYFEQIIGSNRLPSNTSCLGDELRQGAWFNVKAKNDFTNVVVGVIPLVSSNYHGYLEIKNKCEDFSECTVFSGIASFILNKDSEVFIFATAPKVYSDISPNFGAFMFYVSFGLEKDGTTLENRIMIESLPFTAITLLGKSRSKWPCNSHSQSIGVWYGLTTHGGIDYMATTCGEETSTRTGVSASGDYYYPMWSCFKAVTDPNCGVGSSLKLRLYGSIHAINTSIFFHAIDEKVTEAFSRINIYEENVRPNNSLCSNAENVKVPSLKYFNTMFSTSSRRICGFTEDGIKGVWYYVSADKDTTLQVTTDDLTSFYSHVGIYKQCITKIEESWPTECLSYGDYIDSPVGRRGTIASYKMKRGESVFVFVGAYKNVESGLGRISFSWGENNEKPSDDESNNGLSGGAIFGIVLAILIVFIFFAVTLVGILFIMKKKGIITWCGRTSYSDF